METRVLENGVWVTRRRELWEIMQGNQPAKKKTEEPPAPNVKPIVGILTRPIIKAPVVSFILPARIRGKDKNDVLFIGPHFVIIKELSSDGSLEDIASMHSAHQIVSAKVFGSFGKPSLMDMDFIKAESSIKNFPHNYEPGWDLKDIPLESRPASLPLQMVVLSDSSGSLIFIYAQDLISGSVEFRTVRIAMPSQPTKLQQPGRFLAVDPKSRAMAAAAHENCLVFYALQPMKRVQEEIWDKGDLSGQEFQLIKEERVFQFEGLVRGMEFLYPPADNEDRVILLLLVSRAKSDYLVTYEWNCSDSLRLIDIKSSTYKFLDESNPLCLVIPLTLSCALLLVHQHSVSIWSGLPEHTLTCKYQAEVFKSEGGHNPDQEWAAWTRPARTEHWSASNDAVYIVNDKGMVRFLEISMDGGREVILNGAMPVGELYCNVDRAFTSLDMGVAMDDFLITAGSMSNGGLYMVKPKEDTIQLQKILNWSPMNDLLLTPVLPVSDGYNHNDSPVTEEKLVGDVFDKDRIFTCTGNGDYGAVTELKEAVKGQVKLRMTCGPWTEQLWVISNNTASETFILQSTYGGSRLFSITADPLSSNSTKTEEVFLDSQIDKCGLDLRSQTFAIGVLGDMCIQIGKTGIHKSRFPHGLANLALDNEWHKAWPMCDYDEHWSFELASIKGTNIKGNNSQLIAAIIIEQLSSSGDAKQNLLVYEIRDDTLHDSTCPRANIDLSSIASSLLIFELNHVMYIAVGTSAASIQVYRLEDKDLLLCCEYVLGEGHEAAFDICESIALLQPQYNGPDDSDIMPDILLCGLRSGTIVSFKLLVDSFENLSMNQLGRLVMGQISVKVVTDQESPSQALAVCGSEFCRISYDCHSTGSISIKSIHLVDAQETATQISNVSTCCWVVNSTLGCMKPLRSVLCATNEEFLLAELETNAKDMPRMLPLSGSRRQSESALDSVKTSKDFSRLATGLAGLPYKILYSTFLNVFIVAFTRHSKPENTPYSSLKFLDPNTGKQQCLDTSLNTFQNGSNAKDLPDLGKPGERIMDITEWWCSKDSTLFHFLVIGTAQLGDKLKAEKGRLLIWNVLWKESNRQREIVCTCRNAMTTKHPVNSVVAFGKNSLLISAGSAVELRILNTTAKKFEPPVKFDLDSHITQISVKNGLAYVSSKNGSFNILRCVDGRLIRLFQYNELDELSHIRHLALPNTPFVLNCDTTKTLTLLEETTIGDLNILRKVAVAKTTGMITRLRTGHVRSPWTVRPLLPGIIGIEENGGYRDIIGSATSGTVYQIFLLKEAAWRLLNYIQNLVQTYLHEPEAFTRNPQVYDPAEPRPDKDVDMYHIKSELLEEALKAGTDGLIKIMGYAGPALTKGGALPVNQPDLDRRQARVAELVNGLLSHEVEDPLGFTVGYIRQLLEPIW